MTTFKRELLDQVSRLIRRHLRLEVCAVDEVHWHKTPDDREFNYITVVMRDRAKKVDTEGEYRRVRIPVLQNFLGGHCGGYNWNPRKGDLVYCFFYQERKGVCLGNYWDWAAFPICRPSPYDIADKGGQWMEPYQDGCGDFPRQPYPELKKPYCFRWFHGPVTGNTGPGRDWCWMFDYCQMGDGTPDCRNCQTIDSICRLKNQYLKVYSQETESRKAYPYRAEFHAKCGSFWMFESTDQPSEEYVSEVHTEGEGYWALQGAKIENNIEVLKGHLRHSPCGTIEGHSATPCCADEDNIGHRWKVYAPCDTTADSHGLIAAELINLEKKALVRIYKNGDIRIRASVDITGATGKSEMFLGIDGHCWLWDLADDTYIEFLPGGSCTIKADPVTINGDLIVTGSLTHGNGPCCNSDEFVGC